jgi:hypothetical protein
MMVMKHFSSLIILLLVVALPAVAFQTASPTPAKSSDSTANFAGRWQVKFTLLSIEKHLIFQPKSKGAGSFLLLDTGPDNNPVANPQPAAWSKLTNDRVSFSGEAELPIGTCCREIGTLIFKGKFTSSDSITGVVIFVTSVDEEESPFKLRSEVGTFTASRVIK